MAEERLEISFPDVEDGVAREYRKELQEYIASTAPQTEFWLKRTDESAQEIGTILVVILGSKVAVEIAQGVADWLRQRQTSKLKFTVGTKTIEVDHLSARSAEDLANKLLPLLSTSSSAS
jgi:Effector Associated Constant Component 1